MKFTITNRMQSSRHLEFQTSQMNKQITKFQHQVPQHYLRLWVDPENRVWLHDLLEDKSSPRATRRILGDDYFYEKDSANPSNEIENYLGDIESAVAPLLKSISKLDPQNLTSSLSREEAMCEEAARLLSAADAKKKLLDFISAQLIRTLRTVEEIESSIEASDLSDVEKKLLLQQNRPYELVKLGMERLPARLIGGYTIVLSYVEDNSLVTSDHPVSEILINTDLLPQTVYNVLHKNDTILSVPLGPNFHCFLLPDTDAERIIMQFRTTLASWTNTPGIDSAIVWRQLQPQIIKQLRILHTGFGRKFLISAKNEDDLIKNSTLIKKSKES